MKKCKLFLTHQWVRKGGIVLFLLLPFIAYRIFRADPDPLIYAEEIPYKIRPLEEGGVIIPFQENTIYGIFKEDLALPTPLSLETLIEQALLEGNNKESLPTQIFSPYTTAPEGYYVQLKAFKSPEEASLYGHQLCSKQKTCVAMQTLYIETTSLEKGTLYHLMVGPFLSQTQAQKNCVIFSTKPCLILYHPA